MKGTVYIFKVKPMGAVRSTQNSRWLLIGNPAKMTKKQKSERERMLRYLEFKDLLREIARASGFKIPDGYFWVRFYIAMTDSWSQKKKDKMYGTIHRQKPDTDNCYKAFTDAMFSRKKGNFSDLKNDSEIADVRMTKYWCNPEEERIEVEVY